MRGSLGWVRGLDTAAMVGRRTEPDSIQPETSWVPLMEYKIHNGVQYEITIVSLAQGTT